MNDVDDQKIRTFHQQTELAAAQVAALHQGRLACSKGCHGCCVDELTVFEVEANRIRRDFPQLLAEAEPHPSGFCAFLDAQGSCRIYESRPYVCRTQGLPLRWLDEAPEDFDDSSAAFTADDEWVEYRDVCPLNLEGEPALEDLEAEACWSIGPFESQLAELQREKDGGKGTRIRLRGLFATSAEGEKFEV